jgi:hypothetical protein
MSTPLGQWPTQGAIFSENRGRRGLISDPVVEVRIAGFFTSLNNAIVFNLLKNAAEYTELKIL